MTRDQIKQLVLNVLGEIAPEADPSSIRLDVSLRDQLDVDSVDYLNFIVGLHKELGVEIPESDYSKMSTLDRCIDYLAARMNQAVTD